jgi:peptidoglycan/xylan/chitin deacetylase (PgdA/CDA1 family)
MRKWFFQFLYFSKISAALQTINRRSGRFPILVFHRVSPHPDQFWPPLTVPSFEKTLILLKKHYTLLPLEGIFAYTDRQLSRACFITFDDGFEDTYEWARPLLLKHAVPASFFLPTNCIANREVIWPIQLRNSLCYTPRKKIDFQLGKANVSFSLSTPAEKIKTFAALVRYLSKLKEKEFLQALSVLFEKLGQFDDENIQIINLDQTKTLAFEFGVHSHTHNHYCLSGLNSERLIEEFDHSVSDLNKWVGIRNVNFLAYPIGDYSEQAIQIAGNYFKAAFRVGDTLAETKKMGDNGYRMKIPRFNIHHESPHEVFALINGFHGAARRILNLFAFVKPRVSE